MSKDDWRQWLKRIRAERVMLETMDERDITDEQDQRFHASADRLDDLMTALGIICAEV
jgi:ribosome assembly protein YihI (activator of Der GTPase)